MVKGSTNSILAFFLGTVVAAGGTYLFAYQERPSDGAHAMAATDLFPKLAPPAAGPAQPDAWGEPATPSGQRGLADVPTMIARLAERLEQSPDNPEGWRMLGWSYLATGQAQKAVAAYAKAVELKGEVAQYRSAYGEAVVQAANGEVTPAAREAFDAALVIDPTDTRARYFVGLAKKQAGDGRGAYPSSLSQALDWMYRANPKDEFALFHLGEANSRAGNEEVAAKYWRSLLDVLPENSLQRTAIASKLEAHLNAKTK